MSRQLTSNPLTESWVTSKTGDLELKQRLIDICHSFHVASGWRLRHLPPAAESMGATQGLFLLGPQGRLGWLQLQTTSEAPPRLDKKAAVLLAASMIDLLNDWLHTRAEVRLREAELAAQVSMPVRPDNTGIAHRLQLVVQGGCQALNCVAGGLYLMDDAAAAIKLRVAHGLPGSRLLAAPRPLAQAVAGLEAMCGYAVTLSNRDMAQGWNPPENYPASVCVPVATPSAVLGTLWLYARSEREFTDDQVHLAEIIAGRLAAELERETLLVECQTSQQARRTVEQTQESQASLRHRPASQGGMFEWSARTSGAGQLGGDFCDWVHLPGGRLGILVGDVLGHGPSATLAAEHVQGVFRAHAGYQTQAGRLLDKMNHSLLQHPQRAMLTASAFCGTLDLGTGLMGYSSAGHITALRYRDDRWKTLTAPGLPLGLCDHCPYDQYHLHLSAGEILVLLTNGASHARSADSAPWGSSAIEAALSLTPHAPADSLAQRVEDVLHDYGAQLHDDWAVLVIKPLE